MTIDKRRCFKKNPQIICKESGGGRVLVDPYRRTLVELNPVAGGIWEMLDGACPVSGVIDALRDDFEVDPAALEKDVLAFLRELVRREMIE